MSKKTLLILGTSGVLALGIAAPTVAWAESRNNQSISHPGGEERQQKLAEALAKELGLEPSKVSDALTKVREQMRTEAEAKRGEGQTRPDTRANHLDQLKTRMAEAVKAGKLTQAEADAIIKAAEGGLLNGGGHGRPGQAPK
ncbi:hypothetical protein Rhe02_25880 [Rhizocola hellebori]|uniref:Uncharacterized protein n=1 Tax=Rhizocola hellebori TaxID=1392758 RepID=A0A8J3Q748_9ACTN|nr:hypothetical protein [Rhizocola hellebori]GIH04521.1 hypothetical protein Rhe02_25880 [Rhizocola hellebori]